MEEPPAFIFPAQLAVVEKFAATTYGTSKREDKAAANAAMAIGLIIALLILSIIPIMLLDLSPAVSYISSFIAMAGAPFLAYSAYKRTLNFGTVAFYPQNPIFVKHWIASEVAEGLNTLARAKKLGVAENRLQAYFSVMEKAARAASLAPATGEVRQQARRALEDVRQGVEKLIEDELAVRAPQVEAKVQIEAAHKAEEEQKQILVYEQAAGDTQEAWEALTQPHILPKKLLS